MKLTVHIPDNCQAERRYIVSLVFEEFLGLPVRVVFEPRSDVAIVGADDKELILADSFFATADRGWLAKASMPPRPLRRIQLPNDCSAADNDEHTLPVLFAEQADAPFLRCENPQCTRCSLDIFGTAFFLITRYEEVAAPAEDGRGRYPVEASLAYQEGFLDRPIVDEYVELLWWLMSQQWPGLERKQNRYRFFLSHDVDSPYRIIGRTPWHVAFAAGGDLTLGRGVRSSQAAVERLSRLSRRRPRRSVQYIRVHHVDQRSALGRERFLLHHSPTQGPARWHTRLPIDERRTVGAIRSSARPRNRLAP